MVDGSNEAPSAPDVSSSANVERSLEALPDLVTALTRVLDSLEGIDKRLGRVERAVGEHTEMLSKLRTVVHRLEGEMATKKQMKKLKKVLDQLDVIEIPDDAPEPESSEKNRE